MLSVRLHAAATLVATALAVIPAVAATAATATAAKPATPTKPTLPPIPFEKYVLANGLEVILHQDRSTPIAVVDVWYHVGSKNEKAGRTGFAHLFEHMMFQGSKHWDNEFFAPLQEAGGQLNGSTNTDRTNYWEVVPSNFLELALWLESDRMGFLPDAMTKEKLDNQRDVVKNERRQNYENRPYALARGLIVEAMYPAGHPYSWLTIGSQEDLTAASMEDVIDFYRQYYTPSNATLVVAGDFETAHAKELVEKYFGGLPPGKPVSRFAQWVPKLNGETRIIAQDRVQLPRLYLVWHSAPFFSADDGVLDILGNLLGSGKNSRLYKALVYDREIAQDVAVYQGSAEIASTFNIQATAREGHTLAELETAIDEELARILTPKSKFTPAELDRVKNQLEASFIRDLQQVGGGSGIADRMNLYNHYVGDPGFFQKDLERWTSVTIPDIERVVKQYLTGDRLVVEVVPMPRLKPSDSEIAKSVDRTVKPAAAKDPAVASPLLTRRTLANGLQLVVAEHHELPLIEFNLVVRAGSAADPADRHGLANLTAAMLDEGTTTRSALGLSDALDSIGAELNLFVDTDDSGATLSTLSKHADQAIALFADVLVNPTFPAAEVERVRKKTLTEILQQQDDADSVADRAVRQVLYGDHPYGHVAIGSADAVGAIGRDQLLEFHRQYWRPNNATLIVVGDTTADAAQKLVETALAGWQRGEVPTHAVANRAAPSERVVYLIDKPGAAQSVISVADIGLPRSATDYFPIVVMNASLGGMFSSRLNLNLREDKGYSYGARSQFAFNRAAGPFTASAGVQTKVTKESLVEFMKELEEIRGARPLTAAELEFAKSSIARGFPRGFETPAQIAGRLRSVVLHGLPDDYFDTYVQSIQAVDQAAVNAAAAHVHPERVAIVVVGDAAVIESPIAELKLGTIVKLDLEGRPLAAK